MAKNSFTKDDKNKKSIRCDKILELIEREEIGTQTELSNRLKEEGFNVTQATLSRDIHELGLVKVPSGRGSRKYKASKIGTDHHDKFTALYHTSVRSIDYALNQVVISCDPGTANALCASFDNIDKEDILGTIAGDDTILIVARSEERAKRLVERLREI